MSARRMGRGSRNWSSRASTRHTLRSGMRRFRKGSTCTSLHGPRGEARPPSPMKRCSERSLPHAHRLRSTYRHGQEEQEGNGGEVRARSSSPAACSLLKWQNLHFRSIPHWTPRCSQRRGALLRSTVLPCTVSSLQQSAAKKRRSSTRHNLSKVLEVSCI